MITVDIADPFASQLMARYLANRERDVVRLEKALIDRDFRTVQIIGHNMHGSGSSYGLDFVSATGRKLEVAAVKSDGDELESLLAELQRFIRELLKNSRIDAGATPAEFVAPEIPAPS